MLRFLKNNIVLAIGIVLPILLVIFFILASKLPRVFVDPPQYDFIFSSDHYSYHERLPVTVRFIVSDGKIRARIYKNHRNQYSAIPKLFRFEHATNSVREIFLELPGELTEIKDGSEVLISELASAVINPSRKSPDGFEFRENHGRNGGLMREVFYGRSSQNNYIIEKNGVVITIPPAGSAYYYNLNFLGWITAR